MHDHQCRKGGRWRRVARTADDHRRAETSSVSCISLYVRRVSALMSKASNPRRYKQSHAELLGTDGASQPSGKGSQDTYLKMLSSVKGVTPALAEGIASCYPTMRSLLDAWDRCAGGEPGRKEMLRGIEVRPRRIHQRRRAELIFPLFNSPCECLQRGRKVDGSATHRVIGSTLSANIYRMLTSGESFFLSFHAIFSARATESGDRRSENPNMFI